MQCSPQEVGELAILKKLRPWSLGQLVGAAPCAPKGCAQAPVGAFTGDNPVMLLSPFLSNINLKHLHAYPWVRIF